MLLSIFAFFAGMVSSISGAGGMITLPVLLWAGVPPLDAMGTNKFQSVFGTLSSTHNYFSNGYLNFKPISLGLTCAIIGAAVGTYSVQQMGTGTLETLIPVLLIVLSLYFLFSPRATDKCSQARISHKTFNLSVGSSIGLYGGFFGPGQGSFVAMALVDLLGYNMIKAAAHAKPFILAVNTTSMVLFIFADHVIWLLGIVMSVAQMVGARMGSSMAMLQGAKLVRPVMIIASMVIALKLLLFP